MNNNNNNKNKNFDTNFLFSSDQMAERPISASGNRRSVSQYTEGNDIPEIARFKVIINSIQLIE